MAQTLRRPEKKCRPACCTNPHPSSPSASPPVWNPVCSNLMKGLIPGHAKTTQCALWVSFFFSSVHFHKNLIEKAMPPSSPPGGDPSACTPPTVLRVHHEMCAGHGHRDLQTESNDATFRPTQATLEKIPAAKLTTHTHTPSLRVSAYKWQNIPSPTPSLLSPILKADRRTKMNTLRP